MSFFRSALITLKVCQGFFLFLNFAQIECSTPTTNIFLNNLVELVPTISDRRKLRKEVDAECPDKHLEIFMCIYVGLTCSGHLDMTWE